MRSRVQSIDLDFTFPEYLVATERSASSRVMFVDDQRPNKATESDELAEPVELPGVSAILERLLPGDCLVINDSRVLRRRVFSRTGLEILFLSPLALVDSNENEKIESRLTWRVLCPSSRWKANDIQELPDGVTLQIIERGRVQIVKASRALPETYFEKNGEMPLPPYIQKARADRHQRSTDPLKYQTQWAQKDGSLAAPTASLHFSIDDLKKLQERGVKVVSITLHVGLGTFLPIVTENLNDHVMHAEEVIITPEAWREVLRAKESGKKVWAMGTTVARTLESAACGRVQGNASDGFVGESDLFILPGFEWSVVDVLMTNFHQPKSTLMALVASFTGLEKVKAAYSWAIRREFRLFSYGDLSVWVR